MNYRKKGFWFFLWLMINFSYLGFNVSAQTRGLDIVAKSLGGADFQIGRQYAIFIAVDRYKEWNSLRTAVSDSKAIKKTLESRYYIDEFIEIYDEEASAANIRQLFGRLIDTVKSSDSVLIYYAGHGFTDRFNTGFWIPYDGGKDVNAQERWIANQQIRNFISQMKARSVAMFVDACFSGDLLNVSRGAPPTQDSAYYQNALRYTSRQVLTSGASETVPDESEFSRQLRNYLESNNDPYIDPYSIYDRVRRGVTKSLPLFGTVPGHEQGGSYILFLKGEEKIITPVKPISIITQPANAELFVEIRGSQEAEILVNGKSAGRAPGLIQNLPTDQPLVIEARSGFYSGSIDVTLKPKELKEVMISMFPLKGNLFINADIKEVEVILDDKNLGSLGSGVFRDIASGKHRLELKGNGLYYAGEFVQGDETTKINAKLNKVGHLVVNAPIGTTTRISGPGSYTNEYNGSFELNNLVVGTYFLAVSGADYMSSNTRLEVRKGETIRWNPYDKGRVILEVTPATAIVSLDGKTLPSSYGEYTTDLPPGNHILNVSASEYIARKNDVFIESGKITRVSIRLEEVTRASLNFPQVPYFTTVNIGPFLAVLQESTGPLTIENLPTGKIINIESQSLIANKLDPSYNRKVSLSPGTTTTIHFPSGYLSLPALPNDMKLFFLPKGLDTRLGSAMEIPFTRQGDKYLSPLLAAGDYTIGFLEPYRLTIPISIKDGRETEPPGFRQSIIQLVEDNIFASKKMISSRSTAKTTSILTGIACTCMSMVAYYLGSEAWYTYQNATTSDAALAAKSQGQLWGNVLPVSAGIGAAGLIALPIISNTKPSITNPKDTIANMEESLRKLRSSRAEEIVYSQPGSDITLYGK